MRRALLKSNFSLLVVFALFLGFLSLASFSQAAELDETANAIECTVSQENAPSPANNVLFLPVQVYISEVQAVFLTKEVVEILPIATLSNDILSPFRGPPSLSA